MNKEAIIKRLIDAKHITAEEAIVLGANVYLNVAPATAYPPIGTSTTAPSIVNLPYCGGAQVVNLPFVANEDGFLPNPQLVMGHTLKSICACNPDNGGDGICRCTNGCNTSYEIKGIDTIVMDESTQQIVDFHTKLVEGISAASGIPPKYFSTPERFSGC